MKGNEAELANPILPPLYDVAFVVIPILMLVITITAIILTVRSPLTSLEKALLVALTVLVPLLGGVASLVVTIALSRRAAQAEMRGAVV
ncbi:hypothetical protein [Brevibacterium sp.]|uniref:hypothetical protein n=1 Tax=Brevibacterium sp. TaxID=1701 RepID=UPI0025C6E3A3|nr:hypothetical protein [Brevibacterium sp.]